jgi:hypothetical protein
MAWSRNAPNANSRGYDPYGKASVGTKARVDLFPTTPVAAMAPQTTQFPVRSQMFNESSYGAVSRRMGDEDKTGTLGGTARRRGAARALLG